MAAYALDRFRTPSVKAAMRSLMRQLASAIPSEDLDRIAVPTTLIWGRHDLGVRLNVAEAASARYGWPLHVIENARDDPAIEQPEAFLEALRTALGSGSSRRGHDRSGRAEDCAAAPEQIETVSSVAARPASPSGYHLARRGRPFVILDANERIGDAWRKRWDSLRLFTPARSMGCRAGRSPRRPGRSPRRTRWPTTWRPTRPDSIFPFEPASAWTGSPGTGTGTSWRPATAGSRPTTSWWPRARTTAPGPRLRRRARSGDRAAAFQRVPESIPAAGGRRPRRGRRQLGGRDRPGGVQGSPDLAVGEAPGPRAGPPRKRVGPASHAPDLVRWPCTC